MNATDAKIKFLAIFKPSDFDVGGELSHFPNIISLMDIQQSGRKKILKPNPYNPEIDQLKNETHKKFFKDLHATVSKKIKFFSNKFALKNRKYTLFELTAKYFTTFLTGALKI